MTVFLTAHEYSHKAPQIPDHAATFMSMYHVQHAAQAGMTPTDGWLKQSIQTHIVDVYQRCVFVCCALTIRPLVSFLPVGSQAHEPTFTDQHNCPPHASQASSGRDHPLCRQHHLSNMF